MENIIKINGANVNYCLKGEENNKTLVFLHGYLENLTIWNELSDYYSTKYKVLCIDLPGHGNTSVFFQEHSMKFMADIVREVCISLNIDKFTLIGHSMGGYVSLAFAEYYQEMLDAFVMFHSHVYADDKQKKLNREKEIQMVKDGKYIDIVNTNIPRMYAEYNLEKFADKIEFSKDIALKIPEDGVIAALNGMKNRPSRLHIVENTNLPHLFIAGKNDLLIPYTPDDKQFSSNENTQKVVLNSGHMGMFEDKENVIKALNKFFDSINY